MRKMMMGWVLTTLVAAVLAVPSDARSQSPAVEMAVELESEASKLHDQRDQWAYAADLYLAAVQLRTDVDPQAQEDLLIVANLSYETGNSAGAMAALESAASRVLAGGDVVRAAGIFADAAWVADKAGLKRDEHRLSSRAVELANSSEVTPSERVEILSRFRA